MMNNRIHRSLLALSFTVGLLGAAQAASDHAHDGHKAQAIEMTLNNGKKWETDAALRRGMSDIRTVVSNSLPRIHAGNFRPADYAKLAAQVQEHIDYVTANCKLPEAADQQLHVALEQILEGIAAAKGNTHPEKGVVAIVQALNAYGEHFDHPDWKKLTH